MKRKKADDNKELGGIPYTALEAQIPPPLFFLFYAYSRLGQDKSS